MTIKWNIELTEPLRLFLCVNIFKTEVHLLSFFSGVHGLPHLSWR